MTTHAVVREFKNASPEEVFRVGFETGWDAAMRIVTEHAQSFARKYPGSYTDPVQIGVWAEELRADPPRLEVVALPETSREGALSLLLSEKGKA